MDLETISDKYMNGEYDHILFPGVIISVIFVIFTYIGGLSFWLYLQFTDNNLDDFMYNNFIKNHCRKPEPLEEHRALQEFTLDSSVNLASIPDEMKMMSNVRNARSEFREVKTSGPFESEHKVM